MLFGAHVSTAGGLLSGLRRGEAIGAEAIQIHTQSPRIWRAPVHRTDELEAYRAAQAANATVRLTVCHASYLINLGATAEDLRRKSRDCLRANLGTASAIGAAGLVLHLGSHLGAGTAAVLDHVAAEIVAALDEVTRSLGRPCCPILLENAAGAGGTLGRSFEELALVLSAAGNDERLATCLDTQHLFASGVPFDSLERADAAVRAVDRSVGLDRLSCLHLNDSKVPLGSNRDRHANLDEGEIGRCALGNLVAHPALQHLPAILEVPGPERRGAAAADLAVARSLHAAGRRRWSRSRLRPAAGPTPPPPPAPRREPDGRTGSPRGRSLSGSP